MTITAQETRSRLLDTRSFFKVFLPGTHKRAKKEKAIAVIAERNLGPTEDIQKLSDTMDTTSCSRRTTS